jgi:hypothetical protein
MLREMREPRHKLSEYYSIPDDQTVRSFPMPLRRHSETGQKGASANQHDNFEYLSAGNEMAVAGVGHEIHPHQGSRCFERMGIKMSMQL